MLVTVLLGLVVASSIRGEVTLNHDYNSNSNNNNGMVGTPASLVQKEARGPNRFSYAVNLLVGLNSTMTVSTLNQSRAIYWVLTQRLANASTIAPTPIFNLANPAIRQDALVRATYQCAPNETDCNSITVTPIRLHSIGDYSYQSFINTLDSLYVDYNVSAWVHPLEMQCGGIDLLGANQTGSGTSSQQCASNRTQGVLSVLGSSRVTLQCSILVAQNDLFEPQADLVIRSVEDNVECADTETTQVRNIITSSR